MGRSFGGLSGSSNKFATLSDLADEGQVVDGQVVPRSLQDDGFDKIVPLPERCDLIPFVECTIVNGSTVAGQDKGTLLSSPSSEEKIRKVDSGPELQTEYDFLPDDFGVSMSDRDACIDALTN